MYKNVLPEIILELVAIKLIIRLLKNLIGDNLYKLRERNPHCYFFFSVLLPNDGKVGPNFIRQRRERDSKTSQFSSTFLFLLGQNLFIPSSYWILWWNVVL